MALNMLSHSSFSSAVRPENFDKCCVDSETEEQRSLNIFVGILFEKCNYTPVRVGCVRLTKRRARYFSQGLFDMDEVVHVEKDVSHECS